MRPIEWNDSEDVAALDRIESFTRDEALQNKTFIMELMTFEVVPVTSDEDYRAIVSLLRQEIDEQIEFGIPLADTRGYWHDLVDLEAHYINKELFSLKFCADDPRTVHRSRLWTLLAEAGFIMPGTRWTLPCFCSVSFHPLASQMYSSRSAFQPDEIEMIWTHAPMRRLGLARNFVQHFQIKHALLLLAESRAFWVKCGVEIHPVYGYDGYVFRPINDRG